MSQSGEDLPVNLDVHLFCHLGRQILLIAKISNQHLFKHIVLQLFELLGVTF